jgi:hypothetical protein
MDYETAINITGGLSKTTKMPGHSWNILASACKLGSKLREIPGSTCWSCYAFRGHYNYPIVKKALTRRLENITHPKWVEAMTYLIDLCSKGKYIETSGQHRYKQKERFFRFFDSGDLQSVDHLTKIVEVVKNLPKVKFWLPTREYSICKNYHNIYGEFPSNLVIRLSGHIVDGPNPIKLAKQLGCTVSGVHTHKKENEVIGLICHAKDRGNKCGNCRACWNPKIESISYRKH